MIHCPDERARPTIHTTSVLYPATPSSAAGISGTLGNNNKCGNRPREPRKRDLPSEFWRRRPDLNRGWRFCRHGRDVYRVDSSCFLVGPAPPFSPVFGRNCSQVVPTCYSHYVVPRWPPIGCVRATLLGTGAIASGYRHCLMNVKSGCGLRRGSAAQAVSRTPGRRACASVRSASNTCRLEG